jgi:hypothetical protein
MKLSPRVGLEGMVTLQASQSFPWMFDYLFAEITEERATEWDTLFAGHLRFLSNCQTSFCVEPFLGVGLNWHHGETITTARCIRTPALRCTPLADDEPLDSSGLEPLFSGGVDFNVLVSKRLSVGPTFRLTYILRRTFLFSRDSYGHRGPYNGSGLIPSIGIAVAWRNR